jgi:hypothetical protein
VYFTQNWCYYAPIMRAIKLLMLLVGSAAFTAVMALILAALSIYGIINMGAARVLLFIAWLIGIAGVVGSEIVCSKPWKHYVSIGLIFAVVFGGSLIWLDQWAARTKAEQDARTTVPPLPRGITNPPAPPAIAFVKTPKRLLNLPPVTGNNNTVGSQICPGGICAGGDITGNPSVTNNFGPPSRQIHPEDREAITAILKKTPGKIQIRYLEGGDEPRQFAIDMKKILEKAGWEVLGVWPNVLGADAKGLMIIFHSDEAARNGAQVNNAFAVTLAQALTKANMASISIEGHKDEPQDSISLIVAAYPN